MNVYPPATHPTKLPVNTHTPTQHTYHHAYPPSTLFSTSTCQHTQSTHPSKTPTQHTYQQAHSCNTPITTPTHLAPVDTHPTPINTHPHPHLSTHPVNAHMGESTSVFIRRFVKLKCAYGDLRILTIFRIKRINFLIFYFVPQSGPIHTPDHLQIHVF